MELTVLPEIFLNSTLNIITLVSNLLLALLILLIGYIIAKSVAFLIIKILETLKFNLLAEKTGFDSLLNKADIKRNSAQLIGDLFYWVIMFVIVTGVASFFGLAVQPVVAKIFAYTGVVLLAILVLALGLFLASFISGIARVVMVNLGLAGAKTASRLVYYIVIIFAFLAVLAELGIKTEEFASRMDIFVGGVGLAAAIAFGLGCKDMAADFLHDLFRGR